MLLINQRSGFGILRQRTFDPSVYGVDALDALYAVHGVAWLIRSWAGALLRLRRGSDNAEQDFRPNYISGFLNEAEISQWLNGSSGFVTTIYDQMGGGRSWARSTASGQPQIDLTGSHPVIVWDGGDRMDGTGLVGFTNGQSAVSIAAVVSYMSTFDSLVSFSAAASANHRASMQMGNANAPRLLASANDTTQVTAGTLAGIAYDDMVVQIGRFDAVAGQIYHRVDATIGSTLSWSGSGSGFPASDSQVAYLGTNASAGGNLAAGSRFAALILTRDKLSDTEDSDLATSLAGLIPT